MAGDPTSPAPFARSCERAVEEIRHDGSAIVADVLAPEEVGTATEALEAVFELESDIAQERGWSGESYRTAYALPAKDPLFLGMCTHPRMVALARAVLGPDCVVGSFNGFSVVPQGKGQSLHLDHPHPTPGSTLTLHVVCVLDAFSSWNGATRVVPGTHAQPAPTELAERLEERAVVLEAPAGAAVALDGALMHGAGPNTTAEPRRALHVFFQSEWLQPHWDFPATMPPEVVEGLSDEQRYMLGFDTRPRRFDLTERRIVRAAGPRSARSAG